MAQPVQQRISRRHLLIGLCVLSVCLMIAELFLGRRIRAAQLAIWQLELVVLPWVLFVGSYLSLVATAWFDSDAGGELMRRAFSLIAAAGVLGLVSVLYFGLVF
jgi:hypothetical protein